MDDRYLVTEPHIGKGVFSHVLKATDQKTGEDVAIKVIRRNDMMEKAAEKDKDKLNIHSINLLQKVIMTFQEIICLDCL